MLKTESFCALMTHHIKYVFKCLQLYQTMSEYDRVLVFDDKMNILGFHVRFDERICFSCLSHKWPDHLIHFDLNLIKLNII